ncbi:polysaccharide deacetylase family protein [Nonomuraea sp. CA-218870]|uniref:polysaccharide deacetylase family protein n=1 Tax=Nonomuraea sp. CA-218870 TaxID=3239998 RepID=UPI003D8A18D2
MGGIFLLALAASGCGLASATPPRDGRLPADPTRIDFVDPAGVPGLTPRTLSGDDALTRRAHLSHPELSGAEPLSERLREDARRRLSEFRESAAGQQPSPDLTSPELTPLELNVDWQLVAAGEAIGVRLRAGRSHGSGWEYATTTLWYDTRARRAVDSTGLLNGGPALREVAHLVAAGLRDRGPEVDRDQVIPDPDRFDSMAFNRDGDLVVEFDECEIAPCSLGRLAEAVPAGRVWPLLSDTGRRAQQTARLHGQRVAVKEPQASSSPAPAAASNRAGTVDCTKARCVALTFGGGPGPETGRLLDTLREAGARATFFAVGGNAAAAPELLRRMSAEGHLVGNHSYEHRDLARLPSSKIADSLTRTQDVVTAAIGRRPTLVRAPYGSVGPELRTVARELGLSLVDADVESSDWRDLDAGEISDRVVNRTHPGAIVRLHDTRSTTVSAVPDILERLAGKGYTFVTVPELYGAAGMQAGHLYKSGIAPVRKEPLT